MSPNDADGMANSVDPYQTAPLGAVWSGSALFAQAYLSKNLGSLRYVTQKKQFFTITKSQKTLSKPEWGIEIDWNLDNIQFLWVMTHSTLPKISANELIGKLVL